MWLSQHTQLTIMVISELLTGTDDGIYNPIFFLIEKRREKVRTELD